jgi:hypothetical protein
MLTMPLFFSTMTARPIVAAIVAIAAAAAGVVEVSSGISTAVVNRNHQYWQVQALCTNRRVITRISSIHPLVLNPTISRQQQQQQQQQQQPNQYQQQQQHLRHTLFLLPSRVTSPSSSSHPVSFTRRLHPSFHAPLLFSFSAAASAAAVKGNPKRKNSANKKKNKTKNSYGLSLLPTVPNPLKKLPWNVKKEQERMQRRLAMERARLHRELGIVEDATYEEIVAATNQLIAVAARNNDLKRKIQIEMIKDSILQMRLNERLAGFMTQELKISKDAQAQSYFEKDGYVVCGVCLCVCGCFACVFFLVFLSTQNKIRSVLFCFVVVVVVVVVHVGIALRFGFVTIYFFFVFLSH